MLTIEEQGVLETAGKVEEAGRFLSGLTRGQIQQVRDTAKLFISQNDGAGQGFTLDEWEGLPSEFQPGPVLLAKWTENLLICLDPPQLEACYNLIRQFSEKVQ